MVRGSIFGPWIHSNNANHPNTISGGMQMSTSGGDPVRVPAASIAMLPLNVSPDGAELLVRDRTPKMRVSSGVFQSSEVRPVEWQTPCIVALRTIAALSPDGRMLVYC